MATQPGFLIRDQNLKVHFDGKEANVHKVQKKESTGRRKALGDLTNNSKRHDPNIFASADGGEMDAFKSKHSNCGKKSFSNAKEKLKPGGRKPLSDVSNTTKQLRTREGLKKSSVMGGHFLPNSILEEQFLHNHDECIKQQSMNMSEDYFLETIGLHKKFSRHLSSSDVLPASSRNPTVQPESPRKVELEDIAELMIEDQSSPLRLKMELLSSASCPPRTPESPNLNLGSDYFGCLMQMDANFTVIDTPVLPKY